MSGIVQLMGGMDGDYRPMKTSHEEEDTAFFDREFNSTTVDHFSTLEDVGEKFSRRRVALDAELDNIQQALPVDFPGSPSPDPGPEGHRADHFQGN